MPVPKHRHLQQQVRVLRDEDVESFAWRRKGRLFLREHPWSAWSCDLIFVKQTRKKDDVYEMEGAQCQFQMTVEREERGGVNLNLKGDDEELREWYCNRNWCTHLISVRHTKLVTTDLKKETVQWRLRQAYADEPIVPMKNESVWPGGRHLCHRRAIPFVWQKGGETKLEFRGKGLLQETSISPRCDAILHLDHSENWTSIGSYDI